MESALVLRGVTKTFGRTTALRDIELEVPKGALYAAIGPNGAGKTTCIRIIMSILFPDRGEVQVLGHRAVEVQQRVGYLPEERGVYGRMRVGAFLTYMAGLKGIPPNQARTRVFELLERVNLKGTERKRCNELSKGMLQRVQLIAALAHKPDLLILDEPFTGLDPVNTRLLRDIVLEEHRRGVTIVLSTHAMAQAEEMCEHVVMIHRGTKVLDEPLSTLRRRIAPRTIFLEPLVPSSDATPLRALGEVAGVERVTNGFEISLAQGVDLAAAVRRIVAAVPPGRLEVGRIRLEDAFIQIVSQGQVDDAALELRAQLRGPQTAGEAV
ncbi:MAG TPA: ATP-binding cassette domain-containing protein [Vicinamibacterales bacterium]|nr:ATP-binding cassette domain-containing protein [Vicinamibacterales bacterium]